MDRFWSFFIRSARFNFLLITSLVLFGLLSVFNIPRESAPEVQIPVVIVTSILPGATALDVEELITNKIEEGLDNNISDINKLTSSSREGVSVVVAEFDTTADIEKSVQKVKDEVDKVKPELPTEVEDPVISEVNFVDQPIMIVSLIGDVPPTEFIALADDVSDELKKISGVSRIEKSGVRDKEVQVIVDKEKLSAFGLNLSDVISGISRANSSLPLGSIRFDGIKYNVQFEGDIEEGSEVADTPITTVGGQPVYIRDIAFVSDGVEEETTYSRVSVGGEGAESSVSLSMFKSRGGDITRLARDVRARLDNMQKEGGILEDMSVLVSFDSGELVEEDLTSLSLTGLQTIFLVMLILLLVIGWREALIAGIAIPLSFLVAFIGIYASGNTINFVSLFALILSIGILVDSAIVVTEGIHARITRGLRRRDAALETVKEFNIPLTSGTMTTIAVFAPLFLISGVTGKFIASIPFTIIFVLIASLFVALGIVPLISAWFLRKKEAEGKFTLVQERFTHRFQDWYRGKLDRFLQNRRAKRIMVVSLVIGFITAIAFPIVGLVKVEFFPQEDIDFILVEIEKPKGTTLPQTDFAVRMAEEVLYPDDRIESFITTIGAGSSFNEGGLGTELGNITVNLKKDRKETSSEITEDLRREFAKIRIADVRVVQLSSGPPVGAPVAIKIFGDDINDMRRGALLVEDALKAIPGTAEVRSDVQDESTEFILTLDRSAAAEVGLDPVSVAQTLRSAIHGVTATTIKHQGEDIDVVVKLALNSDYLDAHDTSRTTVDSLRYIEVQTPSGPVLLGSVLKPSLKSASASINHEERRRLMTISSQLAEGANAGEITTAFMAKAGEIELPQGVEISVGGENEEVDQSFQDMFRALIIGMVLVLAILVLQFNSYRHAIFIVIIIPLSLIGIMVGLALTGKALSFPSIMGFIALSGIVVNNSIILIDSFNSLRRKNPERSIREVVVEGATSRLRPITLTTLTTVIGIFPLTYAAELWSPLAYAVIFGLSFSIIVTLALVPALYNRWPGKIGD